MQKIINEDIHAATEIFFSVNESVDLTEAAKAKKKRKLKKVKKPSKDQVLKDKTEIWEGVTGARGYATIPSAVSGGEFQFQLPNKAWPAGRVDFWMKQSDGYTADEIKSSKADINKQIKSLRDSAPDKINKIAIETSSELIQKLIGAEVNNSSISAIVDDLSKRSGDKYYGN